MGLFIAKGNSFEEEMIYADLQVRPKSIKQKYSAKTYHISTTLSGTDKPPILKRRLRKLGSTEEVFKALVLGTRDYMRKNGFGKAVIGLSGGIDSGAYNCDSSKGNRARECSGCHHAFNVFLKRKHN